MSNPAPILPDDPAALKAIIASLQAENAQMSATLRAHDLLVQSLRIRIAKLKKQAFGKKSEKIEREIEQLEFALESISVAVSELTEPEQDEGDTVEVVDDPDTTDEETKPLRRRPRVSKNTPRERRELDPGASCPECGGELRVLGEDVSELIDLITAQLKVIEIARIKKSCRRCEKIVQEPAPSRPIPRSMAGPSLLAYILTAKFDDHVPLYRLNEIFARMGADIPDTTLVDWCGGAMRTLAPLIELIDKDIFSTDLLHADDTPIRVLDRGLRGKGLGKAVKKGRIWAYLRDQRPWSGAAPPGVVYRFAPNWKEEHVLSHLESSSGILQADAYKGYGKLYVPDPEGDRQFREAACWAHWRRDFHDIWTATKSEIAKEALDRIGTLYDIERKINGQPAEVRHATRQKESKLKAEAFKAWAEAALTQLPKKSDLRTAFQYGLNRWTAFTLFLEDGRVAIDNNGAERALRPIGVGRRNWLFAGADTGGETLARAMTLIETAKMNGLDPQAYLADIFDRIHDHKNNKLDELLPWNWTPQQTDADQAAA